MSVDGPRFDLHWIDYTIVVVYFILVMIHGIYASRGQKNAKEYFLAGGTLPWYLIGFSLYASNMSGASFVGLMGGAYDNGLVVFNYEWTATLVLIFFGFFILPAFLNAKVYTVPEYLHYRYGWHTKQAFSAFTVLAIIFIDTAGALYAGGLVIVQAMPFLALWQAVAILAVFAGIYTILGGLSAVVVTDTVQAILLIIGATVIFVFGMIEVGGWSGLTRSVEPGTMELIKPIGDDFLPWPGLWGVMLLGFYYWSLNQFIVQRTLGARNLKAGRQGALFAGLLKLPGLFIMIVPGIIALVLYPNLENPDLAFPTLAFDLLPIGFRGLVAAALIAAIMSSLDSALNAAGTLVTMDFVKPLKPNLGERTLVAVGRGTTAIAMVIGAVYAPMIAGFESLFQYFQSSLSYVVPPIVVVYIVGLFWRGGTGAAATWTILVGLLVGVPMFVAKEVTGAWTAAGLPDIHFTIMSSVMMLIGLILYVGISQVTARPDRRELEPLTWTAAAARHELTALSRPLWRDFRIQALALFVVMLGFIVAFW